MLCPFDVEQRNAVIAVLFKPSAPSCTVLQLKASLDDLGLMYGGWSPFCKSLRYGATLELVSVSLFALCCCEGSLLRAFGASHSF